MIASLTGTVNEIEDKSLVLGVSGVGYRVSVLGSMLAVAKVGQELVVRTYHHTNDSGQSLYGFATKEDVQVFELLLTVPSVGPRTAMNILDVAPPRTLAQAVASKDIKLLTKVSGVGRKTAERILVELKEKFKDTPITGVVADVGEEAISVLTNMGYTKSQAQEVLQKLPDNIDTVEEAVKAVLQNQNG
ncbi:Holliday junction branch migration protein RuvA [bacterium]|nr:Holliday junction branch migration protein RuvA [bacterium]